METRRVLKPGRHCTLGIGDNREHCFVIPVGFITMREYLRSGFVMEDLVSWKGLQTARGLKDCLAALDTQTATMLHRDCQGRVPVIDSRLSDHHA